MTYIPESLDAHEDENGTVVDCYGNEVIPYHTRRKVEHGKTCAKVEHADPSKFIHPADLDGPYKIGYVSYCGRCHEQLP